MSVLTLVHRALPFTLSKKRRKSTSSGSSRGKEKVTEIEASTPYHDSRDEIQIGTLHRDVSNALHVAVKQDPGLNPRTNDSRREQPASASASVSDSLSISDHEAHRLEEKCEPSARSRLARVVSWASIVGSQCRWTSEQEKELAHARKQLARCQKAWSSEQELWLAHIQDLNEEKEAHDGFMLLRTRQQYEEQQQFRKAWKRRRSLENTLELNSPTLKRNDSMMSRLRRLQRQGYMGAPLVTTDSTVLECRG
ncbi:hypothetical protein N7532_004070 [Penicillium argentinense]|uniref:Uncharacterized protein n=1 Tax=Penicillium argentinense TaxID=1131581 RepID=A0A9W9FNM1_9EURO|nr:uncharacterized protein N7532_004070 [Penicillium argentinense]KAJ5103541.1 hypothetical protein N7532_004070 [Penicillium argentinense]